MPRTPQHLLALLLLLSTAAAQTPAPASPPQTSAQPPAAPTNQTRTNLVIEDVVVTDRRGNPISGLKASDFALTEKGAPQQIRTFDEHTAQPPAPATPPLDLPPGVFTNYNPIPPSPALNVLLLDTLNTPLQDQAYLRLQLLKYIRTAPPNQRLAIFGLTTHLILLQGFTADPAILRAAIDRKSLRASQILDNPVTGAPAEQTSDTLNDLAATAGPQQGAAIAQTAATLRQFEAETGIFQLQLRARYTLEALGALARYLAVLPGRKNILWFSGSFPLSVFPDTSLSDPFRATADLSSDLRNTANILSRAQVAVYPIDARGLFTDPTFDASNRGGDLFRPGGAAAAQQRFGEQTAAEQATMRQLAQQTGGRAFVNTNGLAEAVTHAINDGSNFYTLTYSPTDTRFDNTFRPIGLKLVGPRSAQGLSLSYRRGYFAADPNAAPNAASRRRLPAPPGAAPPPPPISPALGATMLRGAPESAEVIFKVSARPVSPSTAPPELVVASGNQPNPALAHAPFRNVHIEFAAFVSQLLTRQTSGNYTGSVRFITLAYNADGAVVNLVDQTVQLNLTPEQYQRIRGGLHFQQIVSLPAKGDFYLRLGVGDLITDRVGSLEIPVAAIKNLPPLAAPPTPPAAQP